jgi:hypothetical protein
MLKFKVCRRLYPLMMLWAVLQSFWPASRSASCRQWRSLFSTPVIVFVSVTFLCKHFTFFIYIVYICGGVVYYIICCALWSLLKFRGIVSFSLKYVY